MMGSEITEKGVVLLRACGFICKVFNSNRRVRTKDWIDIWACKHGRTWLIEVKGKGDRLKPGQEKFIRELENHLGPHLIYILAKSVDDFQQISES